MPFPFQESTGETKTAVAGLLIVAFLVGRHLSKQGTSNGKTRALAPGPASEFHTTSTQIVDSELDDYDADGEQWSCPVFAERLTQTAYEFGRYEASGALKQDSANRMVDTPAYARREARFTKMRRRFNTRCRGRNR